MEAQKKVLDFASEQNKAVFEATKKQLGASGRSTVLSIPSSAEPNAVIEAQKSLSTSPPSLSCS